MEIISVRMDTENLMFLSKTLNETKSELIRDLVSEGRIMKSLHLYKQKKVSLGLAARIAGVSLGEFIDLLKEYGITLNLELADVKESLQYAKEVLT